MPFLTCEFCRKFSSPKTERFYYVERLGVKRVLCGECYYHLKLVPEVFDCWCQEKPI